MSGPRPRPLWERWLSKVIVTDGCWLWTGHHDKDGYARIDVGSRSQPGGWQDRGAHVIAWELHHGQAVPDGGLVHHQCEVKGCVNPYHLEVTTRPEHQAHHQTREVCRSGRHPMSDAYVSPNTGRRQCRACTAERSKKRRAAIMSM